VPKIARLVIRVATKIPVPRTGRYNYFDAAYEVQRWMEAKRGRKARIAEALGLTPDLISPRLRGKSRFSIEQLGVIADEAAAPRGWPFLGWEDAVEIDRTFRGERSLPRPPRASLNL
jgi:transcriptional regulator with XRE-family HTH domain